MRILKLIIIVSCVIVQVVLLTPVQADPQRQELTRLVAEIDFMIDAAKALKTQYQDDQSAVKFNYDALIEQLTITRNRMAEFLNDDIGELRATPPKPATSSLTK